MPTAYRIIAPEEINNVPSGLTPSEPEKNKAEDAKPTDTRPAENKPAETKADNGGEKNAEQPAGERPQPKPLPKNLEKDPSVEELVRDLEATLDLRLFDRTTRRVEMPVAAHQVHEHFLRDIFGNGFRTAHPQGEAVNPALSAAIERKKGVFITFAQQSKQFFVATVYRHSLLSLSLQFEIVVAGNSGLGV